MKPRIGLVLGSGGARGMAHVVALEALDRLGIRPEQVAGTSIGAVVGGLHAGGMSGAAIRRHFLTEFHNRPEATARFLQHRVGKFSDLLRFNVTNPVLVDSERVLEEFFRDLYPADFDRLAYPLTVIASDVHRLERVSMSDGPLMPAIAASMAIPGLMKPVVHRGAVMIDGGAVDPLPIRAITEPVDLIIAIDISRAAQREESEAVPSTIEVLSRAFDLMQLSLAESQKYTPVAPLHRIKARVDAYGSLDFFTLKRIFAASEHIADEVEAIVTAVQRVKAKLIAGPGTKR